MKKVTAYLKADQLLVFVSHSAIDLGDRVCFQAILLALHDQEITDSLMTMREEPEV